MGISRQQFGSAVEATAGLIPVVGPTAMSWVSKANFTAAKLNMRRKKVMESVTETLQLFSQFMDTSVTPALQALDAKVQEVAQTANAVKGEVNDTLQVAKDVKDLAKQNISSLKAAARKKLTRRKNKKKQWRTTTRKSRTT